jgi:hypothetical protein
MPLAWTSLSRRSSNSARRCASSGSKRARHSPNIHRLNVIEATIASLKADVGVLLSSVPVMNERLDALEARVAALEARK